MAVSTTATVTQLVGNDSTVTPYATGFPFIEAAHLIVQVTDAAGTTTDLELGTDYTVTGDGDPDGGDVLTTVAYDDTHTITISRSTPKTQLLDLIYNDDLPAQLIEDAFDKLTFILQEITGRTLLLPPVEASEAPVTLPPAAERKATVLGFDDETGDPVLYELPITVLPTAPPTSGNYMLTATDGVIAWTEYTPTT